MMRAESGYRRTDQSFAFSSCFMVDSFVSSFHKALATRITKPKVERDEALARTRQTGSAPRAVFGDQKM